MNNQKDTKKTDLDRYKGSNVSDIKSLSDISIYEFANKKTEKLVTALYLVSDCMDTDDALKGKIRLLGVELLSDIYKLATLSPLDKHRYFSISLSHIYELLSFLEIAYTIGFISEMNMEILKKEFSSLALYLKNNQSGDKHFTFTLDHKMFDIPESNIARQDLAGDNKSQSFIKDININKRTSLNTMSFTNNKSPLSSISFKKTSHFDSHINKEDRNKKIIDLIKDKKDLPENKDGVSIKDISSSFTDCSEKTIQRDLNALVLKGQIKKVGAKRWSRYSLI